MAVLGSLVWGCLERAPLLESRTYPSELLELMSSAGQRVDQGEGDVSVAREYFFGKTYLRFKFES